LGDNVTMQGLGHIVIARTVLTITNKTRRWHFAGVAQGNHTSYVGIKMAMAARPRPRPNPTLPPGLLTFQ